MTVYSAFGTNGNGATGPATSTSYSGNIVVGMAFEVTSSGQYLNGYYLWRSDSSQSSTAQFCLYQITSATTGTVVGSSTVSISGMTTGAWNYVALPAQLALTINTPYKAVGGWTNNFNDTNSGAGSFTGSYLGGIVNGPLNVYSEPSSEAGTNPIPYANTYQGSYDTASSNPAADYPLSTDGAGANFWIDIQVGPLASVPGPVFYPIDHPARAAIPPKPRLAGVYMGVAPGDTSYGTGQVQWNAGGPVHNPPAPQRTGPLPNFPVIIAANSGWRNAGHSR